MLVHLLNSAGTLFDGSMKLGFSLLLEVSHALGSGKMLSIAAVAIEEGINGLNFSLLGVLHGLATLSNLNFEC